LFRVIAPQNPPAAPARRHQLAIVDLIPYLGDKVMIFPLIDALRKQNDDLEISFFTAGPGRLIRSHPGIDHLYVVPLEMKGQRLLFPRFFLGVLRWWHRELRGLRFHTVVVPRGGLEPFFSPHLAWLLGGTKRVGYSTRLEPECSGGSFGVSSLLTAEVTAMNGVHEVIRGSEVFALAGLLRQPVDPGHPAESLVAIAQSPESQTYLHDLGLLARPYAVIGPGASTQKKQWPAERFGESFRRHLAPRGWLAVLVGGPEVADLAKIVASSIDAETLDLTGKTTFEQLVAVCGGAQCFIGNDSGTSHVAGACGVPTVIVSSFAKSGRQNHNGSPQRTHPLGGRVTILQPERPASPCTAECRSTEAHCIQEVSVDAMNWALQRIEERAEPGVLAHAGTDS
jgi:ADP-heptose:LPS heptosyltransferase